MTPSANGEVIVPPEPLLEVPPADRFCDLVLTGGVASGVVYPWAVLELARSYRFRNIAGTSVGAVAAALTAACEYGRRTGAPYPFEVLRRVPGDLAEIQSDGKTKMLSLFQPAKKGRRLFGLTVELMTLMSTARSDEQDKTGSPSQERVLGGVSLGNRARWLKLLRQALLDYAVDGLLKGWCIVVPSAALFAVALACLSGKPQGVPSWGLAVLLVVAVLRLIYGCVRGLAGAVAYDIEQAVVDNDFGLCRGLKPPSGVGPEFTDWMHEGIQKAAGLRVTDAPLTFADLWHAPLHPGDAPRSRGADVLKLDDRAINLELIVSNVTFGRPYRFPMVQEETALYYDPDEWAKLFPASVMSALDHASRPYQPRSRSDPPTSNRAGLRELPVAELPIVVAARMSMSFPLLFSAVPVHAVDYEAPRGAAKPGRPVEPERVLRPCRLADGGLCSNFPIHLFDAAIPRWPTFGLWLAQRLSPYRKENVWLPRYHREGRGDNWQRFEPRTIGDANSLNCLVPCDHVPARSWPLFRAREIMPALIESFKQDRKS